MESIKERFEAKFEEDESSGCWNWTAGKDKDGYGNFGFAGRKQKAHRVSYQLYIGEIPDGLCVCHKCDNPSCVNPAHLFPGTMADNVRDCINKGRWKSKFPDHSGENNGHVKLAEEDVRTIRTMGADGVRQVDIAREFGVTRSNIYHIVHRLTWAKI